MRSNARSAAAAAAAVSLVGVLGVSVQVGLVLSFLLLPSLAAKAQTQTSHNNVSWELVRPFRFFTDERLFDDLRNVYNGLDKKDAFELENKLQARANAETRKIRDDAKAAGKCVDGKMSAADHRLCYAPYYGWAAPIAKNNYKGTCWNPDPKKPDYKTDGECSDYIHPKSHRVRAWLDAAPAGQAAWYYNDRPITTDPSFRSAPCSSARATEACIEFDVPYDEKQGQSTGKLEARSSGTPIVSPTLLVIRDTMVVGLGDSYASGEGAPDLPASFVEGRHDKDLFHKHVEPRRDVDGSAMWLDRACHRSMYSYQFKTALQLALEDPQRAITFVSYSCSGATTDNIIEKKQAANEIKGKTEPQLNKLVALLGTGDSARKVDYVLLSTGGNDIGFANYVRYVVIPHRWHFLLGPLGAVKTPKKDKTAKAIRARLIGTDSKPGNYKRLSDALVAQLNIDGCSTSVNCSRILLTLYPDPMHKLGDGMCEGDVFSSRFVHEETRDKRIKQVDEFVSRPLDTVVLDPSGPKALGWTLIDGHLSEYLKHGFCVPDDPMAWEEIPVWKHGKWEHGDPKEYSSYADRQRWVRIPVDAKLTSDQRSHRLGFGADFFFEDITSSIMHPTAEALSFTASANVEAIKRSSRQSETGGESVARP